jgi:hypothetical protein
MFLRNLLLSLFLLVLLYPIQLKADGPKTDSQLFACKLELKNGMSYVGYIDIYPFRGYFRDGYISTNYSDEDVKALTDITDLVFYNHSRTINPNDSLSFYHDLQRIGEEYYFIIDNISRYRFDSIKSIIVMENTSFDHGIVVNDGLALDTQDMKLISKGIFASMNFSQGEYDITKLISCSPDITQTNLCIYASMLSYTCQLGGSSIHPPRYCHPFLSESEFMNIRYLKEAPSNAEYVKGIRSTLLGNLKKCEDIWLEAAAIINNNDAITPDTKTAICDSLVKLSALCYRYANELESATQDRIASILFRDNSKALNEIVDAITFQFVLPNTILWDEWDKYLLKRKVILVDYRIDP